MRKILVVSGPTASGKSYLAEELLKKNQNAIILNADSMQVYKDLPILSAQPCITRKHSKISNSQPYKVYGFLDFYENCSVGKWLKVADETIKETLNSNKLPVIIGGTGLYLKALLEGITEIPDIAEHVKKQTQEKFLQLGKDKFYEMLAAADPVSANKIHCNDSYRMQRAMAVYTQTGQSITSFKGSGCFYEAVHISVSPERSVLYQNCDLRFKAMLKAGAEQEVKMLFEKIQTRPGQYNIENTLGYRSLVSYLNGKLSLEEAILETSQATRNYAKRQCTWFNNQFPNKISLPYTSKVSEIKEEFLRLSSFH